MVDVNIVLFYRVKLLKELKLYLKHHHCFGLVCNKNVCFC